MVLYQSNFLPLVIFWYSFCSHSHCSICEESRCAFEIYTLCEQWAKSGNMRKNRYKYKKDQDMCLKWLWCLEFQVPRWARKKTHRNKRCHHFDVVSSHSVLCCVNQPADWIWSSPLCVLGNWLISLITVCRIKWKQNATCRTGRIGTNRHYLHSCLKCIPVAISATVI